MGLKRKMMDKMMPKEFGAISGLFHAGVFTLQDNIIKTLGDIGFKDYIFPSIKEAMDKFSDIGLETIQGENIEEFGKRFINLLKKSMLVENANLIKKSENSYVFNLNSCFMAKAAHQVAGTEGVCPMAMSVAAMIEKHTDKQVKINYSNLSATGSSTKIEIL